MSILAWIAFGLLAGLAARYLMPGQVKGGLVMTTIVGIVGALVGGFLGHLLLGTSDMMAFDIRSFLIAIAGAVLVIFLYGKFAK